ncbi:HNH endonuclease family protein [Streptomyces sp. col6]|uniref:HNH endonuclease family protein n=1 Tax=Streptomyces sp. col6 TaxID=2478958 RepID=UPI0017470D48
MTACTTETTKADDSKPAATESSSSTSSSLSGAPGGAPDGAGLPLADAIKKIPVAAEKRAGYERDSFKHWVDEDEDGCSTRQEVLIAEAVTAPKQGERCALTGGSWRSYYDEAEVTDARKLDIDHMVPLAEAFDSGAYDWTPERRQAYANDLSAERSLVAVTAKTNRSKADKDPAAWMPPSDSATCTYLVDWTATKLRWGLTADEAEQKALLERAEPCGDSVVQYESAS